MCLSNGLVAQETLFSKDENDRELDGDEEDDTVAPLVPPEKKS